MVCAVHRTASCRGVSFCEEADAGNLSFGMGNECCLSKIRRKHSLVVPEFLLEIKCNHHRQSTYIIQIQMDQPRISSMARSMLTVLQSVESTKPCLMYGPMTKAVLRRAST